MSIWATAWVWEQNLENPGQKLTLLALAHFADADAIAYPGQERLAEMTSQGKRTVRRHLASLEQAGYISRTARWREDGTRNSDVYQLAGGCKQPAKLAGSGQDKRPKTTGQAAKNDSDQRPNWPGIRSAENRSENSQGEEPSRNGSEPLALGEPLAQEQALSPKDLMEAWNEVAEAGGLAKILELSADRQRKVALRLREHPDVPFWERTFQAISRSAFLRGENKNQWRATFDWMFAGPANVLKIIEGQYDEKT